MTEHDLHITICNPTYNESVSLQFLDILLDETLLYDSTIYVPTACFETVSTRNHRLPCKQVYELLLRLATEYPVILTADAPADLEQYSVLSSSPEPVTFDSLKADCYIVSRYKQLLQQQDYFDAAVSSLLELARSIRKQEELVSYLSDMLSEAPAYQYLYAGSQPFLIYTGDSVCYQILTVFARQFGAALHRLGYLVEYFDLSSEDFTESYRLIGRHYQAVIGVQSYMFSVKLNNGMGFLHDKIGGSKYNFLFDHPSRFENHLKDVPSQLTLLTVDRNYAAYARKTYPVDAIFFPPGGIRTSFEPQERIYDVTFIGSYFDNFSFVLELFSEFDRKERFLANRFWLIMKKNPSLPAEHALSLALDHYHMQLSWNEFAELFHKFRDLPVYLSTYYRMKVLKTLLDADIPVHVFGTSWSTCPLRENPNFLWHNKDLSTSECLSIWQQSKIALNTMTWHKDAITERILNAMLQKAAVLTERNPYMEEHFSDGKDVLLYDLDQLSALPELVRSALSDPAQLSRIAQNGYQNALTDHTWDSRAKEFIHILEKSSAQKNEG